MSRKIVIWLLATLSLVTVSLAEAQPQGKVPRIGYLSSTSLSAESSRLDGFRQVLRDLGYVEEKNIVIEYRFAEGKFDRLPDLAVDLVRHKVDVIVTTGSPATHAAQQATRTIPIVMTVVGDPVPRFVPSLAKSGGKNHGIDPNCTTAEREKARAFEGGVSQDLPCGSVQ
jgi:putative ABC transport system substrate-binding protein